MAHYEPSHLDLHCLQRCLSGLHNLHMTHFHDYDIEATCIYFIHQYKCGTFLIKVIGKLCIWKQHRSGATPSFVQDKTVRPIKQSVDNVSLSADSLVSCQCYSTNINVMREKKHYENKPIQIYWKFYHQKKKKFQIEILIFIKFLLKT